ncbi:unnamed protein product, partial [Sphacelaria rigidula]
MQTRYWKNARFVAHVHADVPERMLREIYEASGYRTRFISYEIASKVGDAPVQPGVIPAPTGRPPAVAAAAAAAAADAVKKAAAAAAAAAGGGGGSGGSGGGDGTGGDGPAAVAAAAVAAGDMQAYGAMQPKVRGNIIAGSLIGATFARSFGADGMWEGTVAQFIEPRNRPSATKSGGGGAAGRKSGGSGVEIVDGYVKENGKYRRGPGGWSFAVVSTSTPTATTATLSATS